ncbi:MAG: carboxypeptidase M32 [Elusimicrobia bacterium]|nr:carboxypeptidase M32 [Elusimicrobiota bacterium]
MTRFRVLRDRMRGYNSLSRAAGLLDWDQEVCMPRGGGEARALQIGAVRRAAHEIIAADETGRLVEELAAAAAGAEPESEDAALWRWTERQYRRRRRQPASLVEELASHCARSQEVWVAARAKRDFALFRPELERMIELKRRQAEAVGSIADPYDAWLEEYEPGMTTAGVRALFAELKPGLVALVAEVAARKDAARLPALAGSFPLERQRVFVEEVARAMGFDFERGRLDVSAHPFSASISSDDVRLTTRYREDQPFSALFGAMHEAGHGLYEQGVGAELKHGPLCRGATMAAHESQSRLWENLVGRGRGFWKRFLPRFAELFPQAAAFDAEGIYGAVNRVERSFIRVEADELTYGLHIMLRFDLERDLLGERVRAAELPEAWAAKSREYFGIVPPDDAQGVLQDVHWAGGLFGYFPTYAIGNLISVQLHEAALKARPDIPARIEAGDFSGLLGWLRENVHRHGAKYGAEELVRRATGSPISAEPYLSYLRAKYGELYGLSSAGKP